MRAGSRRAARGALPLVAMASIVLVAGSAAAFWAGSGNGAGSADTGTTVPVTLSPGTPTAPLFPGGQASVVLTITNPNVASIRVGSLSLDTGQSAGGFAVDEAHSGCVLSTLSFVTQDNAGAGWTVAGSDDLSVTLNNALSMTAAAANACQGASFTVYLAVGP